MKTKNLFYIILLVPLIFFSQGCNFFEAFEDTMNEKTAGDLISEGNHKLGEGKFAEALERFERAAEKESSDEANRGKASAQAALAGFTLLEAMDLLQHGHTPSNSAQGFFETAKQLKSRETLEQALMTMDIIKNKNQGDFAFLGIARTVIITKLILDKYDTNKNGKLDYPDQIRFDMPDKSFPEWTILYSAFSSSSGQLSIDRAYSEIAIGFKGPGLLYTAMAPFSGTTAQGSYTELNQRLLKACSDLADKIKFAESQAALSEEAFIDAIIVMDGNS